jgi:glycopeptide antibiotics resistance protein
MIDKVKIIIQQQMNGVSASILVFLSVCSCIIVAIILLLRKYIWKREVPRTNILLYLIFSIYFCALIYITLGNRELGSRDDARWIPFLNIFQVDGRLNIFGFVLMFLNIVLFIPYGFIITLIQRNSISLYRFLLVLVDSLLVSAAIEVVQRITKLGFFEIEDIICNTFGGIIGWIMASIGIYLYHLHQEKTRISLDF